MMLPAMTASEPNFLTPRRWPAESRPLRDEPPAFLCAMGSTPNSNGGGASGRGSALRALRAGVDTGDAHHRVVLAMAALAARVLPAALLEGDHLLVAAVADDLARDADARQERRADLGGLAVGEQQDLAEGHGRSGLALEARDRDG